MAPLVPTLKRNITTHVASLMLFSSVVAYGQTSDSKGADNSIDTTKVSHYKMKYPAEARRRGIQGTVKIKITFDSQCNVIKKEVVQSLGYGCDEEALIALTNVESRIKKANDYQCSDGEELIYPVHFKLE